jgi:membrane dipeptidase
VIKNNPVILILILLLHSLAYSHATLGEKVDKKLWAKALALHEEAIVIDTHCDTPMVMMSRGVDIGIRQVETEVDLPRMKEGGLDAVFFAIYVSNEMDLKHPFKEGMAIVDEVYRQVEKYPQLAEIATASADIYRLHRSGKRAILMGLENGGPIEDSLRFLRQFYRLGIRYITLTHARHNRICDSATGGKARWNGLSPFGKSVVAEMNRLGMVIDVSHVSDATFWQVVKLSKYPVMASHSCVRSLCHVPRNLSDDMIRAIARQGGVVQLNFYSAFLDEGYRKKSEEVEKKLAPQIEALREKYKGEEGEFWQAYGKLWRKHAPPRPSVDTLIDHVDYIVKLVGIDYVGLGSDFDGASSFPGGLGDVSKYPVITYHLLKRGYRPAAIKKILGGNFLRVFKAVEQGRAGL